VADGTIYVMDANLVAMDLATGQARWTFRIPGARTGLEEYTRSAPAALDGKLFVGANNGRVYGVDGTSGQAVWEFATQAPIRSSPSLAGGLLYIGSSDKHVYALAIDTGRLVWKHALPAPIASTPWPDGNRLFVGCDDGRVYALH